MEQLEAFIDNLIKTAQTLGLGVGTLCLCVIGYQVWRAAAQESYNPDMIGKACKFGSGAILIFAAATFMAWLKSQIG